jgi:CRISPR/Cas system CMR subunit Cmr6 (Cas7 group RAMP superfamily)
MFKILLLLLLASCGLRTTPNVAELAPTKQRQKIALLQKKLQFAEKEQKKVNAQVERLGDEMREAELAYIHKQVDNYEELIRRQPSKMADFEPADLFLEERERLHKMIHSSESVYEAQVVLDRILQLMAELDSFLTMATD